MFGVSCNRSHHLLKGTSPVVQAWESLGREARCSSAQAAEGASMTKGADIHQVHSAGRRLAAVVPACANYTLRDYAYTYSYRY